jgi:hypothetical protein
MLQAGCSLIEQSEASAKQSKQRKGFSFLYKRLPPAMEAREVSWHVDQTGWTRVTTLMFISCGLYWLCDAVELGLMSYLVTE